MGAGMRFGAKILGLSDLQASIDSTVEDLREAEDPATMAAGQPIRERWAGLVPVKDGNYRDSLVVVHIEGKGAAVGTAWLGRVPREEQPFLYSKRLEFGDSVIPAQPSARPALAAAREDAIEAGAEPFRSVVKGRRKRKRPTKP